MTPQQAAAYVRQLKPKVAILMHYKTALGGPAQLAAVNAAADPFLPVVYQPSSVVVNQSHLPAATQVWVMQPLSDTAAVNTASYAPGSAVSPGAIASAFGPFSGSQTAGATGYPLPRKIGDTDVLVDGKTVPLFYVSPGQVNFQVPRATAAGQSLVEVQVGGATVGRAPLTVVATAPGLFAVLNQDGNPNSPGSPAHPGGVLQIFATGLGTVSAAVDDGVAAPTASLSLCNSPPDTLLASRQLRNQFCGLAPGMVGVWQVNAQLPDDIPQGMALPLVLGNGLYSNTLPVAVAR